MQSRLFDEDPLTGIRRIFHYEPDTKQVTIETQQEVEDIVERNKFEYNLHDERSGFKGDMHRVASIPLSLYFELKKKGLFRNDAGKLSKDDKRWLNDKDNRFFRTRPGTV